MRSAGDEACQKSDFKLQSLPDAFVYFSFKIKDMKALEKEVKIEDVAVCFAGNHPHREVSRELF